MVGDHDCSSSGLDKGLGGRKQEVMVGYHDCSSSGLDKGLGGRNQEVMVGDHNYSRSGLDKGPSGVGQANFLSAARELRNRDSQNDATTSSTGEHTYYSTAPRELWAEPLSKDLEDATTSSTGGCTYYSTAPEELWTQLLSKDVQDLDVVETQNNEGDILCVEVLLLEPSDLVFKRQLAEGGQAHVYFATCPKFPIPVVVKRLKAVNVDLLRLRRRMEKVMQVRKKHNSAICTVLGVGQDADGNVCIVMEKMDGDLRTLINQHLPLMPGGQMPFDYNEIIAMMLDVAQGMEDLHGCDLIHADLKASNILIYPVPMEGKTGEEEDYPVYFRAKIGDFDTPDDIVGTGFWRAPEVLEALKNGVKPTLSPSADVYSYGMLCYELLTGQVPLDEYAKCDYNVIISGRRPELPAHVNCRMKEMLSACWRAKPQDRPAWTWIREILEKELLIHPPCLSDKFAPGCRIRRMIFNIRRGQRFGESMCIKSTKTIVFP